MRLVLLLSLTVAALASGSPSSDSGSTASRSRRLLSKRVGLQAVCNCAPGERCNTATGICDACPRDSYQEAYNMTSCQDCGQWVKTKSGKQWKKMYTFVTGVSTKGACIDLLLASESSAEISFWVVTPILFFVPFLIAVCMVMTADDADNKNCAILLMFTAFHIGLFINNIVLGCAISDQPESFEASGRARQYNSPTNSHNWMLSLLMTFSVLGFIAPAVFFILSEMGWDKDFTQNAMAGFIILCYVIAMIVAGEFKASIPENYERDSVGYVSVAPQNGISMANFSLGLNGCVLFLAISLICFSESVRERCGCLDDLLDSLASCAESCLDCSCINSICTGITDLLCGSCNENGCCGRCGDACSVLFGSKTVEGDQKAVGINDIDQGRQRPSVQPMVQPVVQPSAPPVDPEAGKYDRYGDDDQPPQYGGGVNLYGGGVNPI